MNATIVVWVLSWDYEGHPDVSVHHTYAEAEAAQSGLDEDYRYSSEITHHTLNPLLLSAP